MNKPRFFLTDVFTAKKYGGNPLATFVDGESLSDREMQQIAKEINFSETTFITSRQPKDGGYDVRIFTPTAEVEFAGHPTLGTAYVIREKLRLTAANEVGRCRRHSAGGSRPRRSPGSWASAPPTSRSPTARTQAAVEFVRFGGRQSRLWQ